MTKVAFIVFDKKQIRFGILYLYSYLKAHNKNLELYMVEYQNAGQLIKHINPHIICFSVMSGEFDKLYGINTILKNKGIKFLSLWGGAHPTFNPEIIKKEGIDAVCRGEGEEALLEFCQKMPFKTGDFNIKNWLFKINSSIIENPLRELIDLEKLSAPDYTIFDITDKTKISATVCRGCYFNCTYCFNRQWKEIYKNHNNPLRTYPVKQIIEPIERFKRKNPGLNFIVFHDSIFPINKKQWVNDFCRSYKQEINLPFQVNLHPSMVNEEGIRQLAETGAAKVNFAIETGNPMLRSKVLDRHMTNEVIVEAAKIVKRNGLILTIQNMTCLPFETWEDAKATLNLNIKCRPDTAVISKFVPYPKTRLAEIAIENGFLKKGEFEEKIPDNYHWISLLDFKDRKEKQKMEYLVNFFTLGVAFPALKPLIYLAVRFKKNPFIDKIYAYIDTHTWQTIVHQDNIEKFKYTKNRFYKPKLFIKLMRNILINKKYNK